MMALAVGRRRLVLAALMGAIHAGCIASPVGRAAPPNEEKHMSNLFDQADAQQDQAYLAAEAQLRGAGDTARGFLAGLNPPANAQGQLLLACLLAWLGPRAQDFTQALALLDSLEAQAADSPAGRPRAVQVAEALHRGFDGRVAELMALRLLKLPSWPAWKRRGAMLYLKNHARPALTEVLALLAAGTADDAERQLAVDAVQQAQDPQLKAKLASAQATLVKQGRKLPDALADVLARP